MDLEVIQAGVGVAEGDDVARDAASRGAHDRLVGITDHDRVAALEADA